MTAAISARAAADLIAEQTAAIYLDTRTVAEFASGRPRGHAINIPLEFYHPKTGDAHPNESFELVVEHALPRDLK